MTFWTTGVAVNTQGGQEADDVGRAGSAHHSGASLGWPAPAFGQGLERRVSRETPSLGEEVALVDAEEYAFHGSSPVRQAPVDPGLSSVVPNERQSERHPGHFESASHGRNPPWEASGRHRTASRGWDSVPGAWGNPPARSTGEFTSGPGLPDEPLWILNEDASAGGPIQDGGPPGTNADLARPGTSDSETAPPTPYGGAFVDAFLNNARQRAESSLPLSGAAPGRDASRGGDDVSEGSAPSPLPSAYDILTSGRAAVRPPADSKDAIPAVQPNPDQSLDRRFESRPAATSGSAPRHLSPTGHSSRIRESSAASLAARLRAWSSSARRSAPRTPPGASTATDRTVDPGRRSSSTGETSGEAALETRVSGLVSPPNPDGSMTPEGSWGFGGEIDDGLPHSADVSRETLAGSLSASGTMSPEPERMPHPPATRVFTVANQKGGVGKTTTAVNLAAALAQGGLQVLVLDCDPQGNASTALAIPHGEDAGSLYDVLVDSEPLAKVISESPEVPGLLCAPATVHLSGAEIELVPMVAREMRLARALEEYLEDRAAKGLPPLDYVFIDCPPSLGLLTVNAFVAGTEVLIPIQCEYYALEGLSQLLNNIQLIRRHLNRKLHVSTILLTMYDARTRLAAQVADEVRSHFEGSVLRSTVPRSVRISEAPSHAQTVITYDPSSSGALSYLAAAREIAERGANQPETSA